MTIQNQILILVGLIILSAFFSGVETALFSLNKLRIKHLVKQKVKGAKLVEKLKNKPHRLLITILIGNNVVNIGASALATSIAYGISANYAVGMATGIMTLVILIFGEITPKSFATVHNEKVSLKVAGIINVLQIALFPLVILFESFTILLRKMFKYEEGPLVTEEEIKTFVSVGAELGEVKESEKKMIHRIFRFTDLTAKDIMTPRHDITKVSINDKIKDVVNIFHKEGHSRIPVCKDNLDHIKGVVHLMDVQKALIKNKKNKLIGTLTKPI